MHLSLAIILVLCLYTVIGVLDQISIQIGPYTPLFAAVFTGMVMGDLKTGLMIGATLQLMTLGVATYGGATVPDFLSGAIMGTAYAILSGKGVEYGIGIAVPIGLLLTQLDILGRMANTFVQHRADRFAEEGNYRGVDLCNVLGILPWTLSRVIPVFIGLYFGEQVVKVINEMIPAWIMTGLKASGAILPAMGIAILMRYLPIKKYWPYFLVGFVMLAFGAEFFSVLGVALVGLALAAMYVMNHNNPTPAATTTGAVYEDDEEIEIDD
ncbi:PTS sugar transporter subunit IIC [Enterococcus hulanensis]|uniref:PTS sugar transporter subunit IIC n=1 Tax=Enterococcus hulanensis TaxID=2559929 RepID=A0ABU3F276_9ENTE|nr:PTS sugar transporter subunit IIC [Enterococcus hulanensis]MDT2600271.1 PTS sugar transporter subunit IIC [Enterococcus hulanensis]MDT2609084.1 PTS sugar transporter subunit IIC [Enterococcus hulanensis]MDT2616874.1 PTS sugar transporter subunit IIC [Enterococcus hulanensis]MDT2628606.1 PTS sugar transporter subunit IIC [Enterococcus hulanensis]MDT2655946.1 PTS sugar transporter subunit IIC [Enterococcus hulanensis]